MANSVHPLPNSFVTIGDSNYFLSVAISAIQAEKFHPDCRFGVYDWGFSSKEREFFLTRQNVDLIDWSQGFVGVPFPDGFLKALERWMCERRPLGPSVFEIFKQPNKRREWLFAQKPYCLLDWASRQGTGNFIFLDGDAFIVQSVNELQTMPADIGVTLRRQNELDFRYGSCSVLNAGVIAFVGGSAKNIGFIEVWIDKMNRINERWIEQTALTRLIFGYIDSNLVKPNTFVSLTRDTQRWCISILDCEDFNFNWIEEGVDPQKNKVVHFKGGRHSGKRFSELACAIGMREELEEVMKWR